MLLANQSNINIIKKI